MSWTKVDRKRKGIGIIVTIYEHDRVAYRRYFESSDKSEKWIDRMLNKIRDKE